MNPPSLFHLLIFVLSICILGFITFMIFLIGKLMKKNKESSLKFFELLIPGIFGGIIVIILLELRGKGITNIIFWTINLPLTILLVAIFVFFGLGYFLFIRYLRSRKLTPPKNLFSIISKNESIKINWVWKSLFEVVILGLILFGLTFWITAVLVPNPEIQKTCYIEGENIKFILDNPSKYPAEDYNLIIYEKYWHGHSTSYVVSELCTVDVYPTQSKYTLIHCDYIPPNSQANINIDFENKTKTQFKYSSWGKTTPKETNEIILCQ